MNTVPNVMMINRHVMSSRRSRTGTALALVHVWIERARQRRALAALDDRSLQDIGLSRSTAAREIEKPFWQP